MPELPEVETVRRGLDGMVTGRTIASINTDLPKMLRGKKPRAFTKAVAGSKINSVNRRGKMLILNLSNGLTIVAHLKMTGQLLVTKHGVPVEPWTHVTVELKGGRDIRFRDIRQFGYMEIKRTEDIGESGENMPGLGPEPLDRSFTSGVFAWRLKKRPKSRIKALLIDQSFIAGIGNIYADEVLHYAGVKPGRRTATLSVREREQLYNGIRKILRAAIEKRGTSVSTFVDTGGQRGGYRPYLKVYKRAGEMCPNGCGPVKRIVVGGRSSHYCPKCQK